MKKILLSVMILLPFLLTACDARDIGWGTVHISNPNEYGEYGENVTLPIYMPESLEGYTVNEYSYTLYAYMDMCYEIFLDITVNEEQFHTLLSEVRAQEKLYCEQAAYYADGYTELVFCDSYEISEDTEQSEPRVGWADIDKVIYNEETGNIIFEIFHANDTGVYELENMAYFHKFGITQEEYVENLEDVVVE